ncbi:MAG: hypothetical protein ACLQU3_22455 [Limisphaerales bacterium]
MPIFTTTENRPVTARIFGWLSLAIGTFATLALVAAVVFRIVQGFDGQSIVVLGMASGLALLAFVIGGASGLYSFCLVRSKLARVALALCIVPLASVVVGRLVGGPW